MYCIFLKKSAEKDLKKIKDNTLLNSIGDRIDNLASDPRPSDHKKLRMTYKDAYRIRVRDYRIIYKIQDSIHHVEVICITHRKDAYR